MRHLRSLPSLGLEDTKNGDVCCPICLISFENIHEDEMLACQREDSRHSSSSIQPEGSNTMHGVVKLSVCGHVFCRRECVFYSNWIHIRNIDDVTCRFSLAEWIESFVSTCAASPKALLNSHCLYSMAAVLPADRSSSNSRR